MYESKYYLYEPIFLPLDFYFNFVAWSFVVFEPEVSTEHLKKCCVQVVHWKTIGLQNLKLYKVSQRKVCHFVPGPFASDCISFYRDVYLLRVILCHYELRKQA
jgi:hypothetical protein